ncbi:MAG: hypothetical protein KatS3mg068_1667 [Candidatus Sericytochromatia bacterium]|nr:MAG: hypothetical protein KatS3mg068_1667 [Candidatus Sericytochromatia bacterium]
MIKKNYKNYYKVLFKLLIVFLFLITNNSIANAKLIDYIFFKDTFNGKKINCHAIKVDLNHPFVKIDLALAYNNTNRRETVKSMAKRTGALVAINGSFFHSRRGIDSVVGLLISNNIVLADSGHRRTSLGITEDRKIIIGIPKIRNILVLPELGKVFKINGINQIRGNKHLTIYNRYFGTHTRTNKLGREILVDKNNMIVAYKIKNSPIPQGGFVISIDKAGSEIAEEFPLGARVYIDSIREAEWKNVRTLITGSPQLVKNGKIYNTFFKEKLNPSIKYPAQRSAIGLTHNNKFIMLTAIGKLTLTKLAQIMKRLGCIEALALDGGGSVDLYMKGKNITNNNRPVTNSIIVRLEN